jgi:hypothetical protein
MYILIGKDRLKKVEGDFPVSHLDVDRLLANWRWLFPAKMQLVARNAFGDLFLCDEAGHVHWLDVGVGKLEKLTDSEEQFRACLQAEEFRERWLVEADEREAALRGLVPDANQCIAFAIPLVFKEGGKGNTPYIIDLYEGVSFLGDLHHQLLGVADHEKVRLHPYPGPK